MRTRVLIFILLVALITLAIAFWLRPVKQVAIPISAQPVQIAAQAATPLSVTSNPGSQTQAAVSPTVAGTQPQAAQVKQAVVAAQNIPVSFYGKVVDQNNQPVSGVNVTMNVRHSEYTTPNGDASTFPKTETLTDSDGRFEWASGASGDVLSIKSIVKDGYFLSPKTTLFLGPSSGSFENPVIFKMWKEGNKESLIGGSHVFGIDSDGSIYTLNLLTGKKGGPDAEGDLRVAITRPNDADPKDKFQWSFTIAGIGGGLLESDDEFMYLAPESGYTPQFEMHLNPIDPLWKSSVTKQFYISTRNGQIFGNMQVTIHSIYNVHSALEINYSVNPNGSRNLQP